ncbi:DUF6643 family protein [Streptomyces liangshanensis]|uniref:Uncharacterized protein n=1 Tax=Streptomyces liangshanensis TaxID=2717324 RepID=A0A6G9H7Q7_9ACTN|nr:DUF6643 family protein [Streptomyces liangshanensis]QIQ06251.1 hypothetical protein HA039_31580 [Streptomyces liangshanensis]
MTSPRATYGGGYYTAPSFPDTPIYDSLVAERGTPQIAPIRVPSAYDPGNSYLPALPSALPALPAGPSAPSPAYGGYQQQAPMQQPVPLQHAPAPYIPQQVGAPRGYQSAPPQQQQQRPMPGTGYEAMRPAAPRPPAPQPGPYEDPYNRPYQSRGY